MANDLVSCIMVTGAKDRGNFPLTSLMSFSLQTYEPRELIIINQNPAKPLLPSPRSPDTAGCKVREKMVKTKGRTLGELRNVGLSYARGSWFIPWDDDDWQHQRRLATMMAMRELDKAVVPTSHIRFSFSSLSAFRYNNYRDGASGTALFPMTTARYPATNIREDSDFYMANFREKKVLWDCSAWAQNYLRFHCGDNTGSEKHIMKRLAGKQRYWRQTGDDGISREAAEYLRKTLRKWYRVAFTPEMVWHFSH